MATPMGEIKLCKDTQLINSIGDYNTRYFDTKADQLSFFNSKTAHTLTNQMYTRPEKGVVRVGLAYKDVYDCDYMFFRNDSTGSVYENRIFYCFIDDVEYVNEKVTDIRFTEDVIQTWFVANCTPKTCLVERQLVSTAEDSDQWDYDEGLGTGEMINASQATFSSSLSTAYVEKELMAEYIIINTTDLVKLQSYNVPEDKIVFPHRIGWASGNAHGLYHFVVRKSDMILLNTMLFKLYDSLGLGSSVISVCPISESCLPSSVVSDLKSKTTNIAILFADGQEPRNDAGSIEEFVDTSVEALRTIKGYYITDGEAVTPGSPARDGNTNNNNVNMHSASVYRADDLVSTLYGGYVPKNKKLYASPYFQLVITNNNGSEITLKPQKFVLSGDAYQFKVMSFISGSGKGIDTIYPYDYDGNTWIDIVHSLQKTPEPDAVWSSDGYSQWYAANRIAVTMQTMSAVGSVLKAPIQAMTFGGGSSLGAVNTIGSITSGMLNSVGNVINTIQQGSLTPDTVKGNLDGNDILRAIGYDTFTAIMRTVSEETAKAIDSYFSKYGYKICSFRVPDLNARTVFTYVKTTGFDFNVSDGGYNVPGRVREQIKAIFDNGIRFWKNNFLDYSTPNV